MLNRDGGGSLFERGGLFNPTKDDGVSSPYRTRIKSEKVQVQELGGHRAKDHLQIRTSSW